MSVCIYMCVVGGCRGVGVRCGLGCEVATGVEGASEALSKDVAVMVLAG